jgi:hypothetical protein
MVAEPQAANKAATPRLHINKVGRKGVGCMQISRVKTTA